MSPVATTSWGAVVTDKRYPDIWDANYARIDTDDEGLRARDVEAELVPALTAVGAHIVHTVHFRPEGTASLIAELSTRGHQLTWDAVMELRHEPPAAADIHVEELPVDAALWTAVRESLRLFDVVPGPVSDQLMALEADLLEQGLKRWFGVRAEGGSIASMAAVLRLDDVGYIDNVATFPDARGRGFASAITARAALEARSGGADTVALLADPLDQAVVGMYERLGFVEAGRLASTKGPMEVSPGGAGTGRR